VGEHASAATDAEMGSSRPRLLGRQQCPRGILEHREARLVLGKRKDRPGSSADGASERPGGRPSSLISGLTISRSSDDSRSLLNRLPLTSVGQVGIGIVLLVLSATGPRRPGGELDRVIHHIRHTPLTTTLLERAVSCTANPIRGSVRIN